MRAVIVERRPTISTLLHRTRRFGKFAIPESAQASRLYDGIAGETACATSPHQQFAQKGGAVI
jgi:hypothetical protein